MVELWLLCACFTHVFVYVAVGVQSFLVEISSIICAKKDEEAEGFLVDKIVDKTGAKGTGEEAQEHCQLVGESLTALRSRA